MTGPATTGPATTGPANRELKGIGYELFMLLLSGLSILNIAIVLLTQSSAVREVAILVEVVITPVFLVDFVLRLATDTSRTGYLLRRWGWADLVAVVPFLRLFRLFRMARVVRLLRQMGSERWLRELVVSRAQSTFLVTMFLVVAVVEVAGMAIFWAEQDVPDANIKTSGDAIWWGLVTITTVGYGDQFPVSPAGRLVGVLLLFAGVALFSVLTGFIANVFLTPTHRRSRRAAKADSPEALLDELRHLVLQQEDAAAATRARLDDLERQLLLRERATAGNSR